VSGATAGALLFAALLLAAFALEVAARRGRATATMGQAIGGVMRTTPGRVGVLAVWLWLGVHFLAR
jgi:hypothetical protein